MTLSETSGELETERGFPNQGEALGDWRDQQAAVLSLEQEATDGSVPGSPFVWPRESLVSECQLHLTDVYSLLGEGSVLRMGYPWLWG